MQPWKFFNFSVISLLISYKLVSYEKGVYIVFKVLINTWETLETFGLYSNICGPEFVTSVLYISFLLYVLGMSFSVKTSPG